MRCLRCDTENSPGSNFCLHCGTSLIQPDAGLAQAAYQQGSFPPAPGPGYLQPGPTYAPPPGTGYNPPQSIPGYLGDQSNLSGLPGGLSIQPPYMAMAGSTPFIESLYPPHLLVTASPWRRLGGRLLDGLLLVVTLIIGWLIWYCIVAPNGQTPAKQLLNMYVMRRDGTRAGGGYVWLRQFILKGLFVVAGWFLASIPYLLAGAWCIWDKDRQCLWDKMGGTYVAYSPQGFKPQTASELARAGQPPLLYQGLF